jgi:hypothetical protein
MEEIDPIPEGGKDTIIDNPPKGILAIILVIEETEMVTQAIIEVGVKVQRLGHASTARKQAISKGIVLNLERTGIDLKKIDIQRNPKLNLNCLTKRRSLNTNPRKTAVVLAVTQMRNLPTSN